MDIEIVRKAAEIIAQVNPTSRLDICGGGEPTLHPGLLQVIRTLRELLPRMQIQITTNGTMITKGKVRYDDLLDAGVNIVYTDMYAPREKLIALAGQVHATFYEYYNPPANAISPWTYHNNPRLRLIVLQENPSNWPQSRRKASLLGTWFNHLDWKIARQYNLKPCLDPPKRRCNQPFIYSMIDVSGNYLLCCQDNTGETSGHLGNVEGGFEGFKEYWFSPFMQLVRFNLRRKNRQGNPHCCRCCITPSRCDYLHWEEQDLLKFYEGGSWYPILPRDIKEYDIATRRLRASLDANGLPTSPWTKYTIQSPGRVQFKP